MAASYQYKTILTDHFVTMIRSHCMNNTNNQDSCVYIRWVAIETEGTRYYQATELVEGIGKRINNITGDPKRRRICFYFSSSPWHFKGVTRCLFKALLLPASSLQSVIFFST